MRICLFGGSFDPVHCGHVEVAQRALRECSLDRVVFLPCARSPLKSQSSVASDEARLAMLQLALQDLMWAEVDDMDLRMLPPSWTWRLVEKMREKYPHDELLWLMGVDQWECLEQWGRWEYLASMVTFIVHYREGKIPHERPGVRAVFLSGDHPASAREIRKNVSTEWLDEKVWCYIKSHHLYQSE